MGESKKIAMGRMDDVIENDSTPITQQADGIFEILPCPLTGMVSIYGNQIKSELFWYESLQYSMTVATSITQLSAISGAVLIVCKLLFREIQSIGHPSITSLPEVNRHGLSESAVMEDLDHGTTGSHTNFQIILRMQQCGQKSQSYMDSPKWR
jgi:hypothetical protein